jgi:tetratricopeptide (TPR) repeat protein
VGEVLALRDQISSAISEELRVRANPADRERIRGKRLVNPEAYEAWLKGRYFAARYHRTGQQKAVEHFEEAVRLDPGYALAWAGLAHAIGYLEYWDDEPVSDRLRSAMRRAMELDPNLAEAHINYADVKFYGEWDWKSGEAAFRRAVELDPASVDARDHYAICLAALGRNEPALQETERALRLDPLSPGLTTDAGKRWLGLGRPDRAIAMLKRAIDLDSQYGPAWLALASAYEAAAKPKEAMTALMKSRNFDGAGNTSVDSLGAAYETGGMKAMRLQIARERLQAVERRAAAGRVSPRLRAEAYAAVGAREEAFRWLEEAYRQRCPTMTWLKTGQQWDPLRVDPRFQSLLHRMKLD